MNEVILKTVFAEDWIKFLLIVCALLIIMARHASGEKFQYLIKLWNIHRYFIYKHGNTIKIFNFTNGLFFTLRVALFSIFISLFISQKNTFSEPINHHLFLNVCILISSYIIFKFLIEKTFSIILNYRAVLNEINIYRVGLKNLLSVHFYFCFLILIFKPIPSFLITILILNFINVAPVYLIGCYLFFYVNERISYEEIFLLLIWIFVAVYAKYFFGINDFDYLLIYSSIAFFTIICVKRKINSFYIELLGKYSYGMYLFHFLVIFLINKLYSFDNYNDSIVFFMVVILVTILSFLLSLILYNLIEKPIHKLVSRVA